MATTDVEKSGTCTRPVVHRLEHTWEIQNFSHFYVENLESTDSEYPCIYSEQFKCSKDKRIEFYIQLYPNGEDEANKEYLSVYVYFVFNEAARVQVKHKLSLLNANSEIVHSAQYPQSFFCKNTWLGWPGFIEQKDCLDPTKGLLTDDKLTFLLEVELNSGPDNKTTGDTGLENLKSLTIAKNGKMYGSLLKSGDYSDVVLVVNGGELKAHKAILSAHSAVFKAMLMCDMKERGEGRIVIEDMTLDIAKELLKFTYTGFVDLRNGSAEKLLSAADKYGLDLLVELCGQYLVGKVATDNAARFLALADAHSVDSLKRTCIKYIRGHLAEVMLTPDWSLVDKLVIEEMRKKTLPQVEEEEEEVALEEEYPNKKQKSSAD